jgi:undecaprenyl diphosphate synthase
VNSRSIESPEFSAAAPPRHVAIIMDGNGRWAKQRGLPRTAGHKEGAAVVRKITTRARELNIAYLTLYAFSAQNWQRPTDEVEQLMALLVEFCEKERNLLLDKDIRFRVIGERSRLPEAARSAVEYLEGVTANNSSMQLVLALSYGGREEIVHAAREIARRVANGELSPDDITEATVSSALWTHDIPDPDLMIRTSGEVRVSNFLLWQIAYAELFIEPRAWPDFDEAAFDGALASYATRERRFGGVVAAATTA